MINVLYFFYFNEKYVYKYVCLIDYSTCETYKSISMHVNKICLKNNKRNYINGEV